MSKLFKLAIEGIQDEDLGGVCLSMEELVENEISIVEDIHEGEQGLADVDRTLDTADNLSDISEVIRRIKEPTPTDIALVHTAANMAVAGTDADATSLVPGTEGFKDMNYAAESIMEKVKGLIKRVVDSISSLMKKAVSIFAKIKNSLTTYKFQYTEIIKQAQEISEETVPSPKFTITSPGKDILLNGKLPTSFAEYAGAFDQWTKEMSALDKGANLITDATTAIITDFVKTKEVNNDQFVTNAYNTLHKAMTSFVGGLSGAETVPNSDDDGKTYTFKTVYGSNGISVKVPAKVTHSPLSYDLWGGKDFIEGEKLKGLFKNKVEMTSEGGKEALIKLATKARDYAIVSIRNVNDLDKKYGKLAYILDGMQGYQYYEGNTQTTYDTDGNGITTIYRTISEATRVINLTYRLNWRLCFPTLTFFTQVNTTIKKLCNSQLKALHGKA